MARDTCNCYFSFWAIFCPFILLTAQKIKISKKWKKVWRYHHFIHVHQKLWLDNVRFLRYGVRQMGGHTYGRTDGQTDGKSNIYRWVPHLKIGKCKYHVPAFLCASFLCELFCSTIIIKHNLQNNKFAFK